MTFGVLIIWDHTVTLGPFSKQCICIKEHKDRKVTFCDIAILNPVSVKKKSVTCLSTKLGMVL